MRLSLKERKFIFLPTFSLPSSLPFVKVPKALSESRLRNVPSGEKKGKTALLTG